jgi:RHS repeat-associated protein
LTSPAASYYYDQTSYNGIDIGNGKGRRTGMSDASGQTAWSLDLTSGVGWKTTEARKINGITKNIVTQNNLDGSLASITYPSNRTISFTPSGAGRSLDAKDNANGINYVTSATYAPFGGLKGMTNGSSITVSNDYNSRLQPIFLTATAPGGTILSLGYDFHLGNGDNGNVYQIVNNRDNNRTQNFSYDALNRIHTAWTSGPNWGESFIIDAWGNLTNRGPVAGKSYYEGLEAGPANTKNQLTGFFYDAAGNMTNNGAGIISYDAENRISDAGGVHSTYDGDGNRVMKSNGTIYWGAEPVAESDLAGAMQREYVFFSGKRVARRDVSDNSVHYYFSDHLGSTSVVTNSTGATLEQDLDYFPYGGIAQGASTDHYLFTGKERDSESGLDYFGSRYFGSSFGRFMTPDEPFADQDTGNPQSWNLYSYVRNNPLNATDPTGMASWVCKTEGDAGEETCYWQGAYNGEYDYDQQLYWNAKSEEWQKDNPVPTFTSADFNPMNDRAPLAFQGFVNLFLNGDVRRGGPQLTVGLLPNALGSFAAARFAPAAIAPGLEAAANAKLASEGLSASTVFNAGKGVLNGETTGMTQHALNEVLMRGVTNREIQEALTHVPKGPYGSVLHFTGEFAQVRVNQITGKIVTVVRFSAPN